MHRRGKRSVRRNPTTLLCWSGRWCASMRRLLVGRYAPATTCVCVGISTSSCCATVPPHPRTPPTRPTSRSSCCRTSWTTPSRPAPLTKTWHRQLQPRRRTSSMNAWKRWHSNWRRRMRALAVPRRRCELHTTSPLPCNCLCANPLPLLCGQVAQLKADAAKADNREQQLVGEVSDMGDLVRSLQSQITRLRRECDETESRATAAERQAADAEKARGTSVGCESRVHFGVPHRRSPACGCGLLCVCVCVTVPRDLPPSGNRAQGNRAESSRQVSGRRGDTRYR